MVRSAWFFLAGMEAVLPNPVPPGKSEVAELFSRVAGARQFSGGHISDVLLTEPETTKKAIRYSTEFTVTKSGKSFRCEDWTFSVVRENGQWIVSDIKRGRCND